MGFYIYCFWCEFEKDFLKASMGSLPNPVFLSFKRQREDFSTTLTTSWALW